MLGTCAFLFTVISFKFLESSAIFTDSSFLIVMTAGLTKQFLSKSFTFSIWSCFFKFSISFLTDCCEWIGIGLPFCWIIFASSFSCISTSSPLTVWFSLNSFLNCFVSIFRSESSLMLFIYQSVLSLSSVIPNFFIQSSPSSGFVFLLLPVFTDVFVFRLNLPLLLFFLRTLFGCRSYLYFPFPVLCY